MVLINLFRVPIIGCLANRSVAAATRLNPLKMHKQQLRLKSHKVACKNVKPKCGDRFNKPCDPHQIKIQLKQPAPKALPVEKRSIKLDYPPECCGNPCIDAFPRFDLLYYQRTDKLNCKYPQTWSECPDIVMKHKPVCCLDKIKPPKMAKRPPKQRPTTACTPICARKNPSCPQVTLKGCRPSRTPPNCRTARPKLICKKRKSPYPAFSECMRVKPKKRHPIECRCLLTPSMCEVWAYHHYMARIKKLRAC